MTQQDFEKGFNKLILAYEKTCADRYEWNCCGDIANAASDNVPLDCTKLAEMLDVIESSLEGILSEYG